MQKFIITNDGEMRFGDVRLHKDLLPWGDYECHGGGMWQIAANGLSVNLYGASYDFGPADFDRLTHIDWSGLGGKILPLIYYPHYPDTHDAKGVAPGI